MVVSLGKDGAVYRGAQGSLTVTAPKIREQNPIGAGDAMVGGMVWALQLGTGFDQALRWGVACGAATASLEGTTVAKREEAQVLLDQAEVS